MSGELPFYSCLRRNWTFYTSIFYRLKNERKGKETLKYGSLSIGVRRPGPLKLISLYDECFLLLWALVVLLEGPAIPSVTLSSLTGQPLILWVFGFNFLGPSEADKDSSHEDCCWRTGGRSEGNQKAH